MTTYMAHETAAQPDCWRLAAEVAGSVADRLPAAGERVAVTGCGTSWFMAMSYASWREASGAGVTDAYAASEFPAGRTYDRVVVISRSGTTSEVVDLLGRLGGTPTLVLTAVPEAPVVAAATAAIVLDFADETSVVQTRFATSALALLRAGLGHDIERVADAGEQALCRDIDALLEHDQFTFIGRGPAVGLAHEAALKLRETAQLWSEAYPSMDYRHGPISIAQPGRAVWSLDLPPAGLAAEIAATGASLVQEAVDPMAELVVVHRVAAALATRRGLDPDRPRHLSRSVLLDSLH